MMTGDTERDLKCHNVCCEIVISPVKTVFSKAILNFHKSEIYSCFTYIDL